MPEIPQYDWSKLQPNKPVNHSQLNDNGRYWRYKKLTPPRSTSKKHSKAKLIDKKLFNEIYDNQQHLRQIGLEE